MVHEGKDETSDKFEIMDDVRKLGSAMEDEQEYIYKELDIGAEVMLNKEEADGDIKDAKDDESCTAVEQFLWNHLLEVGGKGSSVEVMMSLEGGGQCDGLLQGGDDGLRGDQAGGERVPEIMVNGGNKYLDWLK